MVSLSVVGAAEAQMKRLRAEEAVDSEEVETVGVGVVVGGVGVVVGGVGVVVGGVVVVVVTVSAFEGGEVFWFFGRRGFFYNNDFCGVGRECGLSDSG